MGSDFTCVRQQNNDNGFNSRSRMGSDESPYRPFTAWSSFNSRSRMGSDFLMVWRLQQPEFQFTLPHGERRISQELWDKVTKFQFTLPHGERPTAPRRPSSRPWVSIHAPAWGATWTTSPRSTPCACFNSRSRMGSDGRRRPRRCGRRRFNSRSRMGSDPTSTR